MSRRKVISAGFFILGIVLFGFLVLSFGIDTILTNVSSAGSGLALAVLVWLAIYFLNTVSWKLALGPTGKGMSFPKLFMITVTGFVLNYITPIVALGGEAYKVQALSPLLGAHRAISAVVLYRMVHLIGHMLLLLAGIIASFFVVNLNPPMAASLGFAGVIIAMLIVLALRGTRDGVFDRVAAFIKKHRIFSFATGPVEKYREELTAMDGVLTEVHRNDRRNFHLSVFLEFLSRGLMGVEVWIVLGALGIDVSPFQAIFVYVTYSIAINLLFFIPMNVGAREGGILLGLENLAIDPGLALSVGVILRIREFIWIGIGLLFITFSGMSSGREKVRLGASSHES